jgi:tRNA(Ser,Leu) C12 N-acetylase TAN1
VGCSRQPIAHVNMSSSPTAKRNSQSSKRKRKYSVHGSKGTGDASRDGNKSSLSFNIPKRGGPGVLLTCETGRELKCRREGLEILNYYYLKSTEPDNARVDTTSLSLEDELKQLQSKSSNSADTSTFAVYDTGCRGTIFILCALPNCHLIEPIQTDYQRAKAAESRVDVQASFKKPKTLESEDSTPVPTIESLVASNMPRDPPIWDPLATVDSVLADRSVNTDVSAPSSRFVTRMIPIQATCFASEEELRLTCTKLLQNYFPRDAKTFAIVSKRRNCGGLKRDQIINTVASIVLELVPGCQVHLDKPQITVMVEICRTLCGVSVLKNAQDYKNFNLFLNSPAST